MDVCVPGHCVPLACKNYSTIPSRPLVPSNDPTLMVTNSGMVQFKDVFLGSDKRSYVRAASVQAVLDRWANRRQVIPAELTGKIAPTAAARHQFEGRMPLFSRTLGHWNPAVTNGGENWHQ